MASEPADPNPLEQLIELLVYAPVGLLYDYPEVLPRLVKRGRSQVQLARLLSRMAANQARASGSSRPESNRLESSLADLAGVAWTVLARAITEVGTNVGLAPDHSVSGPPAPVSGFPPADPAPPAAGDPPPITGYDALTARDIIGRLADLSPAQRALVRAHETANRSRKTVLARLDQLDRPA